MFHPIAQNFIFPFKKNKQTYEMITYSLNLKRYSFIFDWQKPAHCPSGESVRQWSGRPGFNRRSSHTKDFKNGTLYLFA